MLQMTLGRGGVINGKLTVASPRSQCSAHPAASLQQPNATGENFDKLRDDLQQYDEKRETIIKRSRGE